MTTPLLPDMPGPQTFGPTLINALPVVDPETDPDATAWNNMRFTTSALAKTSVKALVYFTVSGGVATLQRSEAVWDETANLPAVVRSGLGVYTVTWPATVNDLQDVPEQHSVSLWHTNVTTSIEPSSTHVSIDAKVQGNARSVVVQTRSAAGTPVDISHCYVEVR